jgi:sec-independent protein translocase protein TatA
MFGIGIPELAIIFVLALIVVGPQKLPELARSLGKGMAAFKNGAEDLQRSLREQTSSAGHTEPPPAEKPAEEMSKKTSDTESGEKTAAVAG